MKSTDGILYTVKLVPIHTIVVGDTIEHDGHLKTVGRNNIKFNQDSGTSLFGGCYRLGYKKVKLAIIYHAKPGMKL
jgi:hypothetical protein